ncbi:MAG: 1-acyl-sn-glycerol-3-phosphate acyltransferase [Deltaproteobacteria bacterium]|nr:1-acyl-sn-glycerol-3-phosphate acyltransferase [Deltaproteobacteria bacterium]
MFDDIRPYNDAEAERAWKELIKHPDLIAIFKWLDVPILPEYYSLKNSSELQDIVGRKVLQRIFDISVDGVSFSGLEAIVEHDDRGFLFISNHRDIALDPALMIYAIDTYKYRSVQIAIGDNLLVSPFATDLLKINNCFIVKRNLPKREQLLASRELSAYIWEQSQMGEYLWIAQREGRAKEGNDFTNSALISMLYLSKRRTMSISDFINRLNIVPVSISYEYDPCDELKAKELLVKKLNKNHYHKVVDEDVNSIITGVLGKKGRVHIAFGTPLRGNFSNAKAVTCELDRQIITNYKLWHTNLTAYDELYGTNSGVTEDERQMFLDRVNQVAEALRPFIFQMYANPVKNQLEYA